MIETIHMYSVTPFGLTCHTYTHRGMSLLYLLLYTKNVCIRYLTWFLYYFYYRMFWNVSLLFVIQHFTACFIVFCICYFSHIIPSILYIRSYSIIYCVNLCLNLSTPSLIPLYLPFPRFTLGWNCFIIESQDSLDYREVFQARGDEVARYLSCWIVYIWIYFLKAFEISISIYLFIFGELLVRMYLYMHMYLHVYNYIHI